MSSFAMYQDLGLVYGDAYPTVPGLIQIAKFFDVSTDYLMGRTDKREVNR